MAYFMFRTQIISKSKQSAVACAAYRSGESLYSDRDGLTKKYKEREVLPESYILSPKHAPEWVNNREDLWNEVEKVEKQYNSQLAREIVMALPNQLTNEEQTNLLLDFCKENFSDEGMVADISIHRDKQHNPHAHVMLTLRPFNEDGSWGNKRKKVNGKSVHITNWNERETMIQWRKNFAEKINETFQEKGLEERVSHESYAKQGLDKVPQIRLSRDSYQYEKRIEKEAVSNGKEYEPVSYYGKLNKEIQEINKELNTYKEKEKVVSIDERKPEKEIDKGLESIRKNASLTDVEKSALTMVAKRAKTYVDYHVASNVYKEISEGNWSKKLDKQSLQIQAEKNLINKVHHAYKDNPKNVIQYGFSPKQYGKQMNERIKHLKEMESNYKDEQTKYDAVLKKSELALEVQKEFVSEEFKHLYPDANQTMHPKFMHVAVQHFKDTGKLIPERDIKGFAEQQGKAKGNVPTIADQTRNISKSIFILDRAIHKQQKEKLQSLKDRNFSKVYEASKKMEQYALRKKTLSQELKGNIAFIKAELGERYSSKSLEQVSHPETIIRLHAMNKQEKSTGILQKDISQLYQEQKKAEANTPTVQTPNQQVEKQYMSHVADGILQSLDEIQRANEENQKKPEPKTKKLKRKRHQKDFEQDL